MGTRQTSAPDRAGYPDLPAVGALLDADPVRRAAARHGDALVRSLVREEVAALREAVSKGALSREEVARRGSPGALARRVEAAASRILAPSPRGVVNATGVVVHTNLGRSILSEAAARRVAEAATGYLDLEYDLERGGRGSRSGHLAPLLARLFPGSLGFAVNNNAAAVFLALRALARGKEVVVSRGELVEIGGSFRVPDVLVASGARLREVGTTNRTRARDYAAAIGPKTALLLKIHASNFKIVGFSEEATVGDLAEIARGAGIPLVVDWGSGDLADLAPAGIRDELPVSRILEDGADLVTFSGDKLLGGPQAGIVVGREDLVKKLARDPIARAVRLDRLLIAALRETLLAYVRGREFEEVPTLRMIALPAETIGARAERLRGEVAAGTEEGERLSIVDGVSRTGGGSSPVGEIPTRLLAVAGEDGWLARLERRLRRGDPPVIARVRAGRLLLDLRTVLPSQDPVVARRLVEALSVRR